MGIYSWSSTHSYGVGVYFELDQQGVKKHYMVSEASAKEGPLVERNVISEEFYYAFIKEFQGKGSFFEGWTAG